LSEDPEETKVQTVIPAYRMICRIVVQAGI
jgi:hypothetical protein